MVSLFIDYPRLLEWFLLDMQAEKEEKIALKYLIQGKSPWSHLFMKISGYAKLLLKNLTRIFKSYKNDAEHEIAGRCCTKQNSELLFIVIEVI